MKITKIGTPEFERLWKGSCRQCGSEAEAKESELTDITYDQREGESFSWEKCPVCGNGPYGGMLFYPLRGS